MPKASELIAALESGGVLGRCDNDGDPRWEFIHFIDPLQALGLRCILSPHNKLFCGGWGSAVGPKEDRLIDVILHPESWKIGTLTLKDSIVEFVPNDS